MPQTRAAFALLRIPPLVGPILAAVVLLAACTSSGDKSKPSASAAGGHATVKVAGKVNDFNVVCTKSGDKISATGTSGDTSATLNVAGSKSIVLVQHTAAGTTIYQAIDGLRDDSGKQVGKLTVTPKGESFSGDGTFVLTKLDAQGKRVTDAAAAPSPGSFTLRCAGYATASAAAPAAPSSAPKS